MTTLTAEIPPTVSVTLIATSDRLRQAMVAQACSRAMPGGPLEYTATSAATLTRVRESPPGLVILGLSFRDGDGLDLLAAIENEPLCCRVLILTARRDERTVLRAARCAGWFDPAEEGPDELVDAIRAINRGERYLSPTVRLQLANPAPTLERILSPAEMRVLLVIADGTRDKAAAKHLQLGTGTIHSHRTKIMSKLGVSDVQQLMREAVRRGLLRLRMDGRLVALSDIDPSSLFPDQ